MSEEPASALLSVCCPARQVEQPKRCCRSTQHGIRPGLRVVLIEARWPEQLAGVLSYAPHLLVGALCLVLVSLCFKSVSIDFTSFVKHPRLPQIMRSVLPGQQYPE